MKKRFLRSPDPPTQLHSPHHSKSNSYQSFRFSPSNPQTSSTNFSAMSRQDRFRRETTKTLNLATNKTQKVEFLGKNQELNKLVQNKEFLKILQCKICKLDYPSAEVNSLVSLRMIILYNRHAHNQIESMNISRDMLSQTIKVCQLCYCIITEELERMKVEGKISKFLGIPLQHPEDDPIVIKERQLLPKEMPQWRVLVLLNKLQDYSLIPKVNGMYMHIKFNTVITSYPLDLASGTFNMLRIYYIYGEIDYFLKHFELELIVTAGKNHDSKVICSGRSAVFKVFTSKIESAITEGVNLFLNNSREMPLGAINITVGLCKDKIIEREDIHMHLVKWGDTFIVHGPCPKIEPLPCQWMECFQDYALRDESKELEIPMTRSYTRNMYKVKKFELLKQFSSKDIVLKGKTKKKKKPKLKKGSKSFLEKKLVVIDKLSMLRPGTKSLFYSI